MIIKGYKISFRNMASFLETRVEHVLYWCFAASIFMSMFWNIWASLANIFAVLVISFRFTPISQVNKQPLKVKVIDLPYERK